MRKVSFPLHYIKSWSQFIDIGNSDDFSAVLCNEASPQERNKVMNWEVKITQQSYIPCNWIIIILDKLLLIHECSSLLCPNQVNSMSLYITTACSKNIERF